MKSEDSLLPHLKIGEDIALKGGSSPILVGIGREDEAFGTVDAPETEEVEAEGAE